MTSVFPFTLRHRLSIGVWVVTSIDNQPVKKHFSMNSPIPLAKSNLLFLLNSHRNFSASQYHTAGLLWLRKCLNSPRRLLSSYIYLINSLKSWPCFFFVPFFLNLQSLAYLCVQQTPAKCINRLIIFKVWCYHNSRTGMLLYYGRIKIDLNARKSSHSIIF